MDEKFVSSSDGSRRSAELPVSRRADRKSRGGRLEAVNREDPRTRRSANCQTQPAFPPPPPPLKPEAEFELFAFIELESIALDPKIG